MAELAFRDLGPVRKALEKAIRTDASTASSVVPRYVELRPGIQDKLEAERHHLLTGRRGTGKSTLLHVLRDHLGTDDIAVATLDMERFNGREYPDVLIQVLIELLREIKPKLEARHMPSRIRLRARLARLESVLTTMLSDPQLLTRTLSRSRSKEAAAGADAAIQAMYKAQRTKVAIRASKSAAETATVEGTYEELKIHRLQALASDISKLLEDVIRASSGGHAVVFLDDYYFVPFSDQPAVLGYLH